jgi:hypothetical protein
MKLHTELTSGATLDGNEYAWGLTDFPNAVRRAAGLGYACLGGQFQFRTPSGTCEMYWLDADSSERKPGEPWPRYAERSCEEGFAAFEEIIKATDFSLEVGKWPTVPELSSSWSKARQYLCFVAYFVSEPDG